MLTSDSKDTYRKFKKKQTGRNNISALGIGMRVRQKKKMLFMS